MCLSAVKANAVLLQCILWKSTFVMSLGSKSRGECLSQWAIIIRSSQADCLTVAYHIYFFSSRKMGSCMKDLGPLQKRRMPFRVQTEVFPSSLLLMPPKYMFGCFDTIQTRTCTVNTMQARCDRKMSEWSHLVRSPGSCRTIYPPSSGFVPIV